MTTTTTKKEKRAMTTTTTNMMLHQYRDKSMRYMSLESLSSLYRKTHDDAIIAEAFFKVKGLTLIHSKKFHKFEDEDTISFALEKLHLCLLTYVPGSSNKFISYYSRVFRNKLREEYQLLNTHKRCIVFNTSSLDNLLEQQMDFIGSEDIKCDCLSLPNSLSNREKLYCYLVAIDYGTNQQIADYMGVSKMTLSNLRKNLREKLDYLYKNN